MLFETVTRKGYRVYNNDPVNNASLSENLTDKGRRVVTYTDTAPNRCQVWHFVNNTKNIEIHNVGRLGTFVSLKPGGYA